MPVNLKRDKAMLKAYKSEIETLKVEVEAEFPKAKELDELQTRLNDIDTQLGINISEVDYSDVVAAEEDDDNISYSRDYLNYDDDYIPYDDYDDITYSEGYSGEDAPEPMTYEEQWTAKRVGDETVKPKSLSEIVAKIQHDLGINITAGHIRGKDIRGYYDRSNQGIRTKANYDIPTISHEIGHYLDDKYDIINRNLNNKLVKELQDNLSPGMKEAYDSKYWTKEGFAEFVRKFMQNREVAAIDYPEFTKYFLNSMDGRDQAIVLQFADDVNAYFSLEVDTATSSIRLKEDKPYDPRNFMEKAEDKSDALYQTWNDSNHGIKLLDEEIGSEAHILATNAAYANSVAKQIVFGDLTDINGRYVGPGLKAALQGINLKDKKEYLLFGEYLVVKHGPERLAQGRKVFASDAKNSTNFMQKRQKQLEEQYPAFKEASERLYNFIYDFYNTWGVETRLITKDTLDSWKTRWKYYVPFHRALEVTEIKADDTSGSRKGFANLKSPFQKMKYSELEIINPVDNMISNIIQTVDVGKKNYVMVYISEYIKKHGGSAKFLEQVPDITEQNKVDLRSLKLKLKEKLETLGLLSKDEEAVEEIIDGIQDLLIQYRLGRAYGDIVTVIVDGKPEYWKINDPLLLQSLTSMSTPKIGGVLEAYAIITRFMASNITGNNAVWSIFSNAPRDIMGMSVYSVSKNPVEIFSALGSVYINRVRHSLGKEVSPYYREFLALGGENTSIHSADRNIYKKARKHFAGRKFSLNPLDWLVYLTDLIEMGPKGAEYKMLRERGIDPQKAFFMAMEVNVNWRRGGTAGREVNKMVPFFNASVQGLDRFRRWIIADDIKKGQRKKAIRNRVLGYFVASAILAAIIYALNNSDEEREKEYEQLSNYIKNGFWNIPLGDGKYFAIPKPRELGVLSSFIERSLERTVGENEYAFKDFYGYMAENYLPRLVSDLAQLPVEGLAETGANILGNFGILGTVANLTANRDFLGRPIVSGALERLEPKKQYTGRTSQIAYWVGQAFNMSPVKIDYFFNQVFGGWWKYQQALFPLDEQYRDLSLGVGNTYIKDNQFSNDLTNWLYDKAEESTTAKDSYPDDIDKAITAKMDNSMKDFYSRYYQLAKDKPETDQSRVTRQKVLDMIYDYRAASDSGYFGKYVEQVKEFCKRVGDESYLPSAMPTEIKDGNDVKHQLTDTQYVEYQELYNTEYWNLVEDTMKKSASDKKNTIVLKKIAIVAREEATNKMLKKMGFSKTDYAEKYKGVDSDDVVNFMTDTYFAKDDGHFTQSEAADIILDMNLSSEDSYTLYLSLYDDNEAAMNAYDAGIDANDYLSFLTDIDGVTADYKTDYNGDYVLNKNGDKIPIRNSKKEKIQEMVNDIGVYEEDDYEAYWTLMEAAGYKRPYDD